MLYWFAVFFVISLIGAVFGFSLIAPDAAGVAKILFIVFLVLAVVSLIFGRGASYEKPNVEEPRQLPVRSPYDIKPGDKPFEIKTRPFETEADYYRRLYHEQLSRNIERNLDLSMRIYELEQENKRLAEQHLRVARYSRAWSWRARSFELGADEGMGC